MDTVNDIDPYGINITSSQLLGDKNKKIGSSNYIFYSNSNNLQYPPQSLLRSASENSSIDNPTKVQSPIGTRYPDTYSSPPDTRNRSLSAVLPEGRSGLTDFLESEIGISGSEHASSYFYRSNSEPAYFLPDESDIENGRSDINFHFKGTSLSTMSPTSPMSRGDGKMNTRTHMSLSPVNLDDILRVKEQPSAGPIKRRSYDGRTPSHGQPPSPHLLTKLGGQVNSQNDWNISSSGSKELIEKSKQNPNKTYSQKKFESQMQFAGHDSNLNVPSPCSSANSSIWNTPSNIKPTQKTTIDQTEVWRNGEYSASGSNLYDKNDSSCHQSAQRSRYQEEINGCPCPPLSATDCNIHSSGNNNSCHLPILFSTDNSFRPNRARSLSLNSSFDERDSRVIAVSKSHTIEQRFVRPSNQHFGVRPSYRFNDGRSNFGTTEQCTNTNEQAPDSNNIRQYYQFLQHHIQPPAGQHFLDELNLLSSQQTRTFNSHASHQNQQLSINNGRNGHSHFTNAHHRSSELLGHSKVFFQNSQGNNLSTNAFISNLHAFHVQDRVSMTNDNAKENFETGYAQGSSCLDPSLSFNSENHMQSSMPENSSDCSGSSVLIRDNDSPFPESQLQKISLKDHNPSIENANPNRSHRALKDKERNIKIHLVNENGEKKSGNSKVVSFFDGEFFTRIVDTCPHMNEILGKK
uniref:Uncharacterized protein n=1 Tax=Corethron hystrix TaxID=216773 RepID=A0A6U5EIA3_9STRA|mmetsp:Transcript_18119/g.41270  ORF Transcript_18119/g.41270 Transcript_18119/m.41270 type:complete len:689 (+) Transcript_18119:776-2842(+)